MSPCSQAVHLPIQFSGGFLCLEMPLSIYMTVRASSVLCSSVLRPDTGTHAPRALSCGPSLQKAACPLPFSVPKPLLMSPPSSCRAGRDHGAKLPLMSCPGTHADTQRGWSIGMLRRERNSSGQQTGHLWRSQSHQLLWELRRLGLESRDCTKGFRLNMLMKPNAT